MSAVYKWALILIAAFAASVDSLSDSDIVLHLFTRANPQVSEPLLATVPSLMGSSFSNSRRTVITIHSYDETVGGNFNAFVVPAHSSAEDVNVIAVDWSAGTPFYTVALANAPNPGRVIANFINILKEDFGYDSDEIRIVRVGIGGHVAGIAARNAIDDIPHIIALDPSLRGWTHNPEILNPDDAEVVEVLHTTAGELGYDNPLGDLDFYPNGGTYQNGCGLDISCSHIYSYAFYAESITSEVNNGYKFVGTDCESYEQAIADECSGDRDVIFGGTKIKTSESGTYTFTTNYYPPFARN